MSIFLFELSITLGISLLWFVKNEGTKGIKYALKHFSLEYRVRRYLFDAGFYILRESILGEIAELPKIDISFENNLTFGKIKINNNVKFDKKFETLRLSSALERYVVEIQYLSLDQNWYIFEFYDSNLMRQRVFNSYVEFQNYNKKIGKYELFIDDYSILPIHHALIVGQTGSGKTYALFSLVLQLVNKGSTVSLYFADTKGAGTKVIGKFISPDKTASEIEDIIQLLEKFCECMEKTKQEIELHLMNDIDSDYRDFNISPNIFIFDEFADFILVLKAYDKKTRDHVQSLLSRITLQGRQMGYFLWVSMQKSDSTLLPTFIRENLPVKIVMGNAENMTYVTTFGTGVDIPKRNYQLGQGVYTYPQIAAFPKICSFSYFNFNIMEAIRNAGIVNTGVNTGVPEKEVIQNGTNKD